MCSALVWPRGLKNDECYMRMALRTTFVSCVALVLPRLNPPASEDDGTEVGCIGHVWRGRE